MNNGPGQVEPTENKLRVAADAGVYVYATPRCIRACAHKRIPALLFFPHTFPPMFATGDVEDALSRDVVIDEDLNDVCVDKDPPRYRICFFNLLPRQVTKKQKGHKRQQRLA